MGKIPLKPCSLNEIGIKEKILSGERISLEEENTGKYSCALGLIELMNESRELFPSPPLTCPQAGQVAVQVNVLSTSQSRGMGCAGLRHVSTWSGEEARGISFMRSHPWRERVLRDPESMRA